MTEDTRYVKWKKYKDKSDVTKEFPQDWRGIYRLNPYALLKVYGMEALYSKVLNRRQKRVIKNKIEYAKKRANLERKLDKKSDIEEALFYFDTEGLWSILTKKQKSKVKKKATELLSGHNRINNLLSAPVTFRAKSSLRYYNYRPEPDLESSPRSGWNTVSREMKLLFVTYFYSENNSWKEGQMYGTRVNWAGSYNNLFKKSVWWGIASRVISTMLETESIIEYFSGGEEGIEWVCSSLAFVFLGESTRKSGFISFKDEFDDIGVVKKKELYEKTKTVT